MKVFNYKLILAACTVLIAFNVKAQQYSNFTQFADNLVPVNPTYSLVNGGGALNTLVRKQYAGIEGSPTTFMVNGYLPISSIGATAGIVVLSDELAVEKQTEINAFVAKSVQLSSGSYLAVSLNAGVRLYKADYSSIDPTGQDPQFRDNLNETNLNMGFGVMYYTDKYYVGASMPHLTFRNIGNASVQDNYHNRNSYYLNGAYLADVSNNLKLKPAVQVYYTKGLPVNSDFSAMLYAMNKFGVGVNYRTTGEVAGMLSINIDALRFGYSYQVGIGHVSGFNNNTHEVTIGIRFGKDAKTPKLL